MSPTPQQPAEKMAEKTDQQLLDMLAKPSDWTPAALDAARTELQKRNIRVVEVAPQIPPNTTYVVTSSGRKRFLKATTFDIILSIFLPGWGVIVGLIGLCKGEGKRGATMIAIGTCSLLIAIFRPR